ncbi:hypothetical protein [uncultured Shewanella sp.]|uniref:hypothetical protein n=1 Tax=uncultured Shewanella sp. TaxID=173975 RepID=UPI002618C007|nr:hypothetical protein [uncultured Shewanella sp.]
MSPLDTIITTAHAIVSSGKPPSLALIKRQLGTQYPMPVLIQGLQQYKAMTEQEKHVLSQDILALKEDKNKKDIADVQTDIDNPTSVQTQAMMTQLQQYISVLTQRLDALTQEHAMLKKKVAQLENNK